MKKLTAIALALILALSAACACAEVSLADLMGTVSGETYENAVLAFGFKGEGWTFKSEEEIAATQELTKALLGEEAKEILESGAQVQVMIAVAPDGVTNVNAVTTYLGSQAPLYEAYGMKSILEMGKETFTNQLTQAGVIVESIEITDCQVDGQEKAAYKCQYKAFGMNFSAVALYFISGEYLGIVTVTALDAETAEAVFAGMYWL